MVVVDHIVSEQVLRVVMIKVIISDELRVHMVDVMVAVVDNRLVDVDIGAIIDQLLRVSV